MKIKLVRDNRMEETEMRQVYVNTLEAMAEKDKNIVVMEADLMMAVGTTSFKSKFPERAFNCGVQEANMMGVAAGLSATGKIPFAHTFGVFATRRACDQVFMSGAYAKLNVKIIGSDPGITAQLNGGTHMAFEDLGIMRGIPTMTVLETTDCAMVKDVVEKSAHTYGMFYIRLNRKLTRKIYEDGSEFEIGKAIQVREGMDVTIIAAGYCVAKALEASDILAGQGISAKVLDMFTIKPIDKEAILKSAEETGAIVTAENHYIINGLGSAVAEVLVEGRPVPMKRVGSNDEFGEVGSLEYLAERYGLTPQNIAAAAKEVITRKGK